MKPVVRRSNWWPGVLNDFFDNDWAERQFVATAPAVNIIENDKQYIVEIAAPGLTKNDFRIDVHDENHLIVSVDKKAEMKDENKAGKYLRHEFTHSSFRQVMVLPDDVDTDKIQAKVEDGVLTIEVPKRVKEEKPYLVKSVAIQ